MTDKIKRTPKEWDEVCPTCRGNGRVHRRESFALWTPDEYEHVSPLDPSDPKQAAPSNAYVCTAVPGASVFEACKEGVELAKRVGRPVAFEFNGAVAVCHADSDANAVAKAWWKLSYGNTYEESMRDR